LKHLEILVTSFLLFTFLSNAQIDITTLQRNSDAAQNIFKGNQGTNTSHSLYVNPFIGTGGHGHTYPGATVPFGMIQISPDTRFDGWDGCSGYHYSDSIIYGFSHTHLSGTGVPDYGDVLICPQSGKAKTQPGYLFKGGYGSTFSHKKETATVGYYEVYLEEDQINVKLCASERSGIHQYTFEKKEGEKHILIDLDHRDMLLSSALNLIDKNTISGYRISSAWAKEQHLYFYIKLDTPYKKSKIISKNGQHKLLLTFPEETKSLTLKIGISAVNEKGAANNLNTEIPGWSIQELRAESVKKWNAELNKIQIEDENTTNKSIFYTALYHTLIAPNLFSDADGLYRGRDQKIHQLKSAKDQQYTVFSLWDTYRATHPLYTIIQQEKTNQFINTFLRQFDEGGDLPVWELAGNETECMIAYHSVSVIADAYLKGINGFNSKKALDAMVFTAKINELAKQQYATQGFISSDQEPESVSKTLEYAYDDFCISAMAKAMGEELIANEFEKRSYNFINIHDPSTGFMRAKRGAQWYDPFNPSEVNFNYTEANSWQYSLYAPQHIETLTQLLGGKDKLEVWLDSLFLSTTKLDGREQADITGLIGQYAHGNEPSHHMAYLYNYTNNPSKTQFFVDSIQRSMYSNQADGLSGNEDCGQMSAWYVMSALGFYPVTPGIPSYQIGRPLFNKAVINLENGNKFEITTQNNNVKNKYIDHIELNNEIFRGTTLSHESIMKGGLLVFFMTDKEPLKTLLDKTVRPTVAVPLNFTPVPFITSSERIFEDSLSISFGSIQMISPCDSLICYYRLNNSDWKRQVDHLMIKESSILEIKNVKYIHAPASKEYSKTDLVESAIVSSSFIKRDKGISLQLNSPYSPQYAAAGPNTLIDGITGSSEFRTGDWQGFYDKDVVATILFDSLRTYSNIGISYIRDQRSWIFYPESIQIEISTDGKQYQPLKLISIEASKISDQNPMVAKSITKAPDYPIKSIRYTIKNSGNCPSWHLGNGYPTWLFLDELILEK
jgi:predicted alpha-1,2-mannosidase